MADSLSRRKATEWHLSPTAAQKIFSLYGTPDIDLFASIRTFQVERYMTLDRSDPRAHAVDALSLSWSFPLLYAFPPPTLVPTVVNKLRGLPSRMLLIAPFWSDAPWLPMLLELLHDVPRRLRPSPTLLTNTATRFPVSKLDSLRLTVWPLCGKPQAAPYNRRLSLFWRAVGGRVLDANTSVRSARGPSGVPTSIGTHLRFL